MRTNVDVALHYLDSWLRGNGAVAIHNLMEDAATAEISRSQLWQWIRHGATIDGGGGMTREYYQQVRSEALAGPRSRGDAGIPLYRCGGAAGHSRARRVGGLPDDGGSTDAGMNAAARRVAAFAVLIAACGRAGASRSDSAVAKRPADAAPAVREVPYDPANPHRVPPRSASPAQPTRTAKAATPAQPTRPAGAATPTAQQTPPARGVESVGDPQAIVREYYAAIRAHDFLHAYRMWQVNGQAGGRSFAQFEAGFDSTESVDARVGAAGREEGAAGSRFITVPVDVSARLRNGTAQHFAGTYTLRRVEVPGASAAQHSWHLYAANIRQVH